MVEHVQPRAGDGPAAASRESGRADGTRARGGAGTGTNFELYPATVTEVVAVEPDAGSRPSRRGPRRGAVPVTVTTDTVEDYQTDEPFDAVVCSLVLCSVDDPEGVLRQLFSMLRPGGELRYLEHVASGGARAPLQKLADATVWPRLMGNCHTHRDTERSIVAAGLRGARGAATNGRCRHGCRCRCRRPPSAGRCDPPRRLDGSAGARDRLAQGEVVGGTHRTGRGFGGDAAYLTPEGDRVP